ncbi:amino acid ABC transporter permease [Elioraea tepidiphila]|uniref:amino acid ABC transporter permease n=1 Tax=Elioraea tepidiphila TaxID=457934 RepID=UPI00037A93AA|nr:ABC transporter permease subunit [Elioraea tepidiphila]
MSGLATLWLRPGVRAAVWQALAAAAVLAALLWVAGNIAGNVARRGLDIDFGFLAGRASFEFGENLIGYRPGDTFLTAFLAGLANTVLVAVLGIVLTTMVATLLALARLSRNRLLSRLAWIWIEAVRNTPLLLQLLFWHQLTIRTLPAPRQAWELLPGTFLSNRGLVFPALYWQPAMGLALAALAVAILAAVMLRRLALARGDGPALRTGAPLLLALGAPAVLFAAAAEPLHGSVPALRGFNFQGSIAVSPEFVALLLALVVYQAGFMAETIRSGILGVPKGQVEAAASLGLSRLQQLRRVVFPQALWIIVPPVTSQYLSLTKNSSLAVAIGYPDLVRVSQVTIADTGRAIECITILLLVYLSLSLFTAFLMNLYNRYLMRRRG